MTRFKTLSMAAMIALAVGTSLSGAMAQTAGGGGSSGDGGGSFGFDPLPPIHAAVPGSSVPVQQQMHDEARFCGFELLRGHFCEQRARR